MNSVKQSRVEVARTGFRFRNTGGWMVLEVRWIRMRAWAPIQATLAGRRISLGPRCI